MALVLLAANTRGSGVRRETLEGKTHLVVPSVMMTSGVVPGSKGALYYPAEEMKKGVPAWNNKPVVVYHPQKNGKPSTAADPLVLNTQKVGVVLNAQYTDKNGKARWKADVWINEELGKKYCPEVMDKLEKGQKVEVSTGLYTENENKDGEFEGKKYKGIARDYVPDHLAILPEGTGACSIADGAGLLANACGGKCGSCGKGLTCPDCGKDTPTANAMSFTRMHQIVQKSLDAKFGPYRAHVQDLYDGFVIYGQRGDDGSLKLFKQGYKKDDRKKGEDNQISLVGDADRVERITEYRTADGKFVGNSLYAGKLPEEQTVDEKNKAVVVASVIANSAGQLDDADREWLMKKTPEWLATLPGGKISVLKTVDTSPAPTPTANATPVKVPTFNELLEAADPDTREMVAEGIASARAERSRLTAVVVANARADYTDDELKGMGLKDLRRIAKFVGPKDQPAPAFPVPSIPVANWSGAAGFAPPVAPGNGGELPVLPLPGGTKPAAK